MADGLQKEFRLARVGSFSVASSNRFKRRLKAMREAIRKALVIRVWLALAFLVTATISFAQTTPFDLTGLTGSNGQVTSSSSDCYSLAYVCTSPYVAQIGGSSVSTNVICDDFNDESFVPEDWNAYVTSLTPSSYTIPSPDYLKFSGAIVTDPNNGSQITLSQQQAYETAALLAEDILAITPANQISAAIDSYAMWGLFEPGTPGNPNSGAFPWLTEYASSYVSQAEQTLWNAAETIQTQGTAALDGATVTIYSYASCISGGCASTPPQEFITVSNMPEPSSVAMLAADLFAVAGLVFFFRRRLVRS
jgi:hypothetical protein